MNSRGRTHISYQFSAAPTCMLASTALCSVGILDVLHTYVSGCLGRKPCIHKHSSRLATKTGKECGLTLIELLVTLALLSVTMGIAFSMFSGGGRVWQRAQCETGREQAALLAFQDLRVHLRSFQPYAKIEFKGEADEMTFPLLAASPLRNADGLYEPAQVSYYLREEDGVLCRAVLPYRLVRANRYKDAACTEVMRDVEKWKLSYYGYSESGKDHHWRSVASESIPLSVKIELTYRDSCSEDYVTRTETITLPTGRVR